MDISVRTVDTFVNEDQSWIGKTEGSLRRMDSITLDRSAFDLVTAFPNGVIPSGVVLARITATGLYGPYADAGTGGLGTAEGFLGVSVPYDRSSTADLGAALLWDGEIIEANLPTNHGLTADAKADLAAKFRFV